MATGVGTGFDFSGLNKTCKELDRKLNDIIRTGNKMETSLTKNFQNIAQNGVEPLIKKLQQINTSLGGTSKVVDMINRIVMAFGKLKGDTKVGVSTKDGDAAIKKLQKEIAQLQKQQDKTAQQVDKWKNKYDKLSQSVKKGGDNAKNFQETQSKMLDTAGQLKRALAAAFSVSAIKGYVNKLMQIRGEFELQQRSLQVLLQNKDEANALWDKTVALAVKSPYTTKQLVTATKQLAAYRIESEKLYETNKMLANVSIGLGVDMSRLILAFGQVKAANFLRGTELRQFSEAGVNMLDELAKRFTALEGRAVSVGEVFERVSKRMVSFKDVEAVFKTITSEGGTFYQMQEKQSETLKGMMLNLKDSYELMLNDIGKDKEGTLKGFIGLMRKLVDEWRNLEPVINTAGVAFLSFFGVKVLSKIASAFTALWSIIAAHPFAAVLSAIALLVTYIYNAKEATEELTRVILEVEKNIYDSIGESITLYKKLTETINDVTKSSEERNKAYESLKSKFEEILPDEYLELKYITAKVDGYEAAEKAMLAYYNAKALEQKRDAISQKFDKDIYGVDIPELAEQYKQEFEERFSPETAAQLSKNISAWISEAIEKASLSEIQVGDMQKYLDSLISSYLGETIDSSQWGADALDLFNRQWTDLAVEVWGKRDALDALAGLPSATIDEENAGKRKMKMQEEINLIEGYFDKLAHIYENVAKGILDKDVALGDVDNVWNEVLGEGLGQYIPILESTLNKLSDVATKGSYEYAKAVSNIKSELFTGEDGLSSIAFEVSVSSDGAAKDIFNNFGEELKKEGEKALRGDMQKAIVSAFDYAIDKADLSDASKNMLTKLIPDNSQTISIVRQNIDGFIKQIGELKQQYDAATKSGAPFIPSEDEQRVMDKYLQGNIELLANYDELLPVLKHIYGLLGGENKNKKGELEKLKKQIQLVTELADDYEKLRKEFGKQYADENIWDKGRIAAFGEVDLNYRDFAVGTAQDEINNLEKLIPYAETLKGGYLEVARAIAKAHLEIDSFNKELENRDFARYFESLFGNYELTLEMDKLNIPPDLASKLFNFDSISLNEIRDKTLEMYGLGGMKDMTNQDIFNSKEYTKLADAERKQIEDNFKKISDAQNKMLIEYGKKYSKYLLKSQSERVKIKLDEIKQLEDIELLYQQNRIDAETKATMRTGVLAETQKRLDSQAWKDFKDSGMYVRLFDNLEMASISSLDKMENKLKELKSSLNELDPSELKEINNQLEKIQQIKTVRNPFREMGKDAKNYYEYIKQKDELLFNLTESESKEEILKSKRDESQLTIDSLEKQLATEERLNGVNSEKAKQLRQQLGLNKANLNVILKELVAQGEISKELSDAIATGEGSGKILTDKLSKTAREIDAVVSSMAEMATNLEAAFGMSDDIKDTFELIQGIGSGVSDMFSGAEGLFSGNPLQMLQGGMQMVSGISKVFASLNAAHDKRRERDIEKEIKLVERLEKVYEKLEKQIEKAYSLNTFEEANKNARENIEQQNQAIQRMIEAEEEKKDTDHERIAEWREQMDENLEMIKELESQRLQELGGIGGEDYYKDTIQGLVDAWLGGFMEIGDGLEALEDNFDEVMNNLVKKQLLQRVGGAMLKPLLESIDLSVGDDGIFDEKEFSEVMSLAKQIFPEFNEKMKETVEAMGMTDWAGKNAELGSLSAGIQGISESQADTIAAYLNSLRFYVADSNTQLKALVAAQVNTDTPNPMLSQLLVIAEQTRAIRDMFESVIGRGGNNKHGGAYLKVDIG